MPWTYLTVGINGLTLLLNGLSLLLLPRTLAGFYFSLGVNLLVAPFDGACLGWCLLGQTASPHPSGWLLAALAAATLVSAAKLVLDAMMVFLDLTWKDVPAWGVPTSTQIAEQKKP